VDTAGAFLGPQAAGRTVLGTRSDGVALAFTDHGDGSYSAELPHPGAARTTVVNMSDNGTALGPRLRIRYK
jgi:hypothetical protein